MVQVLESTSLGPKRQLVVARLGEELLVLGASEAGIALLATRAAGAVAPAVEAVSAPAAGATETDGVSSGAVAHLVALFKGKGRALRAGGAGASSGASPGAQSTAFEELLSESREDLELRRKLARGQAGSVR
jgi:flagellar biogenesis protein FliO